jgi:hypothetical protein
VTDPYAKVNERIRRERRAAGRREDEYDALIRAMSKELGQMTEAALGLFLDFAERVGLRYLEEAARTGATRRFGWAPEAVRAARFASSRMPGASGRVVAQSSDWAVRTGFAVLRDLRQRLERTRRGRVARAEPRSQPSAARATPRSAASRRGEEPRRRRARRTEDRTE